MRGGAERRRHGGQLSACGPVSQLADLPVCSWRQGGQSHSTDGCPYLLLSPGWATTALQVLLQPWRSVCFIDCMPFSHLYLKMPLHVRG